MLLQIKNVDIATNGFAIMFCKDKDVSSFFQANVFNFFCLMMKKNNFNNEKIFYLDTESVRRIASTKAFKTMQSYALKKGKGKTPTSQSCMFFDVDGSGKLVLRGAVSVNYLATKSKAHVFVSTKLCKNFEMEKNEEKVTFNF